MKLGHRFAMRAGRGIAAPSPERAASGTPIRAGAVTVLLMAAALVAHAESDIPYQRPSPDLTAIIDAPLTPNVMVDPTRGWLLLLERPSLPSIAELAEQELRLAGMRINPQTNGPSRRISSSGMELVRIPDGETRAIEGLPEDLRIDDENWSSDGSRLLFTNTTDQGVELWVVEVADARARRLVGPVVSLVAGVPPRWIDDASILFLRVPENRGAAPKAPLVPDGPVIQENLGVKAPAATYQDLLASPYDEDLFEHYLTSELVRVDLKGTVSTIGEADRYWECRPSPDGAFLLVKRLHRPYSYLVTAHRFPTRTEVWTARGEPVRELYDAPLQEQIPIARGSVATGPREFAWRDDAPATIVWAEALDGGDADRPADHRDQLYLFAAPFAGEPRALARLELRYRGITWGTDDLALVQSYEWNTRRSLMQMLRPGASDSLRVLFDRSSEDRYSDPGTPLTRINGLGRPVLHLVDGALLLSGLGASPEGNRPFLDRFDLATRETTRLFQSEAPYYERVITVLDPAASHALTMRESVETPPDFYARDLASGELRELTHLPHPTPQLARIQKEIVRYERADSVDLTATLYLPAGYDPAADGPIPMLLWAYPREFKSAEAAGQLTRSPYQFDRITANSPLLWLLRGYAVLENPTMPIVGEGEEEPNDTYVEQLVASAQAAVDAMVSRGVTEPGRIAIGGHSYGAFMAANLLARTDLFACGIARSGAYNRTLTPFGFQSEDRNYWEAPDTYDTMSPFTQADKINEPILLIHGEADNNTGTYPMQSERLFDALKGLGGTARLVMLPHESHGYRARESVLHVLWETERWLEAYIGSGAGLTEGPTVGDAGR